MDKGLGSRFYRPLSQVSCCVLTLFVGSLLNFQSAGLFHLVENVLTSANVSNHGLIHKNGVSALARIVYSDAWYSAGRHMHA